VGDVGDEGREGLQESLGAWKGNFHGGQVARGLWREAAEMGRRLGRLGKPFPHCPSPVEL